MKRLKACKQKELTKYGFVYKNNEDRGERWEKVDKNNPGGGIVIHGKWDDYSINYLHPYSCITYPPIENYIADLIEAGLVEEYNLVVHHKQNISEHPELALDFNNLELKEVIEYHGYLNKLAIDVHANAVKHGWWDTEREFGTLLMLVDSEVSEAFEEYRNGHAPNETYYSKDKQGNDKMEGVPSELADVIIRILDLSAHFNIDIDAAIKEKMLYNASRLFKHGGKVC